MNHQGAHFRIDQGAHFRIWEGMREQMQERIWERMQERIPEPLIGLERSHDKWEGILLGVDEGVDAGADAGADFKSCDLSEPIRCAKARIHSHIRSRERILTNQSLRIDSGSGNFQNI